MSLFVVEIIVQLLTVLIISLNIIYLHIQKINIYEISTEYMVMLLFTSDNIWPLFSQSWYLSRR